MIQLAALAPRVAAPEWATGTQSAGMTPEAPGDHVSAETAQSSILRPPMRLNSRVLWVTRVASSASAWHAIHKSLAPMGVPLSLRRAAHRHPLFYSPDVTVRCRPACGHDDSQCGRLVRVGEGHSMRAGDSTRPSLRSVRAGAWLWSERAPIRGLRGTNHAPPGPAGRCGTPSSILTQGCFSEHQMWVVGRASDRRSRPAAPPGPRESAPSAPGRSGYSLP